MLSFLSLHGAAFHSQNLSQEVRVMCLLKLKLIYAKHNLKIICLTLIRVSLKAVTSSQEIIKSKFLSCSIKCWNLGTLYMMLAATTVYFVIPLLLVTILYSRWLSIITPDKVCTDTNRQCLEKFQISSFSKWWTITKRNFVNLQVNSCESLMLLLQYQYLIVIDTDSNIFIFFRIGYTLYKNRIQRTGGEDSVHNKYISILDESVRD